MRRLLSAVLLVLLATSAGAALREDLGDAKVRAVEAAFAAAVPDATLKWGSKLSITMPDGATSAVRLIGPKDFGTIQVMHVELTDFARARIAHAGSFSQEPAPAHPADFLAAVQLATTPAAVKIARIDPTSIAVEVKKFDVIPEYEVPQTWPGVSVTYWATYATTDWIGSVRWTGAYNVETLSHHARMPLSITKRTIAGDSIAEPVVAARATDEIVEVEGGQSGEILQYPCPMPCLFDGRSLLAGWSAARAGVAAEE